MFVDADLPLAAYPMHILVCTKPVRDPENRQPWRSPSFVPEAMAAGKTAWRISRYDEYALEMALRLKDEDGVSRIDVLAVGDNAASEVLKRSIGMGADHGVLIEQSGHLFQSPLTIGGLIADYARGRGYHLILCGVMSEDLMQGLVGPIIAGLRDWPCLTSVQAMSLPNRSAKLICEREIEGGRLEVLEMPLPALVTVQSGRHPPRYPALSKLLRANRHALEILPERTLVTPEAKQGSHSIRWPIKTRQGNRLEGSAEEKAQQLAAMLRARGFC